MRLISLAVLIIVVAAIAAPANATGLVFSGFNCRQPVNCDPTNPAFPQAPQLIAMTNACVSQNTGLSVPGGFFDEAAGLDGSGCLSTKTEAFSSLGEMQSIPQCCLRQVGAACYMQCNMVSP